MRACDGKCRYSDQETARRAALRSIERCGELLTFYRCQFCHRWHIGHPSRGQEKLALRKASLWKYGVALAA